jgi:hypothetical protein
MRKVSLIALLPILGMACAHGPDDDWGEADAGWDPTAAEVSMWHKADFLIEGTIRNAEDEEPIPYAEIRLNGTALPTDYAGRTGRAGVADRRGNVDQAYTHSWCATLSAEALDIAPAKLEGMGRDETIDALYEVYTAAKRVSIEILMSGFQTHRVEYSLTELAADDGFSVDLGKVELQPATEMPSGVK